jgi:general stress protein YciG
MEQKKKQGFAAMDPKRLEEVARKGGTKLSADRKHMAEIGRKGGERKRKK